MLSCGSLEYQMLFSFPVAPLYVGWCFIRSFLHRGWWLVTSLYLVVEAGLSPFQLVFLGTAQALTVTLAEVPAGVFADAFSRKWSLFVAHLLMGVGMFATGLVLSFSALVVTQMIWGLSWTFSSGADVAWVTDELDDSERTTTVLVDAAKWGQAGSALGVVVIGALAWWTTLSTAIVSAGVGMLVLGCFVAVTFSETRFRRARAGEIFGTSLTTLRQGLLRLSSHRVLIHILICTYLVNGADEAFGRLYTKQLVDLGLPALATPIFWFTLLTVTTLLISIAALSLANRMLKLGAKNYRVYSNAAGIGAFGLGMFAIAENSAPAALFVLVVTGAAMPVIRTVSVIWANQNASSDVRATIQSFLSLAENLGEMTLGFSLAIVASYAGIPAAVIGSCTILVGVVLLVESRGAKRSTGD